MGDILAFRTEGRPAIMRTNGAAQILWFTGVRYVRLEPVDEPAKAKPSRRRTRRAPPPPSAVGA